MFKVNNKSIRITSMTYLTPFFSVSIVDFEQVNVSCGARKTSGTDFSKIRVRLMTWNISKMDSHFQQLCLSGVNHNFTQHTHPSVRQVS